MIRDIPKPVTHEELRAVIYRHLDSSCTKTADMQLNLAMSTIDDLEGATPDFVWREILGRLRSQPWYSEPESHQCDSSHSASINYYFFGFDDQWLNAAAELSSWPEIIEAACKAETKLLYMANHQPRSPRCTTN